MRDKCVLYICTRRPKVVSARRLGLAYAIPLAPGGARSNIVCHCSTYTARTLGKACLCRVHLGCKCTSGRRRRTHVYTARSTWTAGSNRVTRKWQVFPHGEQVSDRGARARRPSLALDAGFLLRVCCRYWYAYRTGRPIYTRLRKPRRNAIAHNNKSGGGTFQVARHAGPAPPKQLVMPVTP